MTIDAPLLRNCRPDHLQRLARSLRVTLPPIPRDPCAVLGWQRRAARVIAAALADDLFAAVMREATC